MALAAILVVLVIFAKRRVGMFTGLVFLTLYGLYLLGLVNNWSFEGVGDLVIAPQAQTPSAD